MNRFRWIWLLAALCTGVLGCDDGGHSRRPTMSGFYAGALQAALTGTAQRHQAPGALLLVAFADGSVWEGGAGFGRLTATGGEALETDSRWRVGSITKTFTGTAVLLLVQDGILGLEDTLDEWLPGMVPGGDRITVRMLLNHTSGLFDYTHDEDFQEVLTDSPTTFWAPAELVDIANRHGPWFEPGKGAAYSNTNYILLGLVIEAASGQRVEDFMQARIFKPLLMQNTVLPEGVGMQLPFSHGYLDYNLDQRFDEGEDCTLQHPSALWTAGAVISTPGDMLVWIREIIDSTLLAPALQAERMALDIPIDGFPGGYFGLGVSRLGESIGHTGAVIGYTSVAFAYKGVYVVAYSNGYLLGPEAVNIANQLYAAAIEAIYGDEITI